MKVTLFYKDIKDSSLILSCDFYNVKRINFQNDNVILSLDNSVKNSFPLSRLSGVKWGDVKND